MIELTFKEKVIIRDNAQRMYEDYQAKGYYDDWNDTSVGYRTIEKELKLPKIYGVLCYLIVICLFLLMLVEVFM